MVDRNAGVIDQVSVSGAFEARSGNTYRSATTGAHEEGFHFELVARRPSEKRARLVATWTHAQTSAFSVTVSGGVERVANFSFIGGNDRTNLLGRVGVIARP
jgi:hypothetical protein